MGRFKTQAVVEPMGVWPGFDRCKLNQRTPACPAFADLPYKLRFTQLAAAPLAHDPDRLEPCGPAGQPCRHSGPGRLQAPPGTIWREACCRCEQHPGPAVRGGCVRQGLGDRHHLHQDPRGLAVSFCRHRPPLAACGRLVRAAPHDDRPGAAGVTCGRLATQTQGQGDDPFRPGIAVSPAASGRNSLASTISKPA